jgi:hypothetical protein
MADVITSNVQLNTDARITTGYGVLAPSFPFQNTFANGTGNDQADLVFFTEVVIPAAGSPQTLNLSDSSLHMPNGAAFAPVKVVEVSFYNKDTANKVTIGGGTQPFTPWLAGTGPTEDVMPGGIVTHTCPKSGWTVGVGSADRIKLTSAGGANVTVQVKITARTA